METITIWMAEALYSSYTSTFPVSFWVWDAQHSAVMSTELKGDKMCVTTEQADFTEQARNVSVGKDHQIWPFHQAFSFF